MAKEIFPQYLEHLDAALENFCESHWPCEYIEPSSGLRCVNVRSGHGDKGHQNASAKIFADGKYEARQTFESLQQAFANNTFFRLEELLHRLRQKQRSSTKNDEIQDAAEIHRDDVMAYFYRHVMIEGKPGRYTSHTVCFCCLLRPPEHALPCGHVLCTQCVMIYGRLKPGNRSAIEINHCPMESQTIQIPQSWSIHLKPDAAGVRILTLDGCVLRDSDVMLQLTLHTRGGIRGIVSLEILRSLEKALNGTSGRLRVQSFFDLVVGTR